jgi:hypothetical protein
MLETYFIIFANVQQGSKPKKNQMNPHNRNKQNTYNTIEHGKFLCINTLDYSVSIFDK